MWAESLESSIYRSSIMQRDKQRLTTASQSLTSCEKEETFLLFFPFRLCSVCHSLCLSRLTLISLHCLTASCKYLKPFPFSWCMDALYCKCSCSSCAESYLCCVLAVDKMSFLSYLTKSSVQLLLCGNSDWSTHRTHQKNCWGAVAGMCQSKKQMWYLVLVWSANTFQY